MRLWLAGMLLLLTLGLPGGAFAAFETDDDAPVMAPQPQAPPRATPAPPVAPAPAPAPAPSPSPSWGLPPPAVLPPPSRPLQPPAASPRSSSRSRSGREPPEAPAGAEPAAVTSAGLVLDPRSRCGVWVPDLQPGETVEWSGPCRNGTANGQGELLRRSGEAVISLTTGRFAEGRLEGPATVALAGGAHLDAEFAAGVANTGTIRFADASVYTGGIRNNLPNGRGSRSWPRGLEYDGNWVNGVRTGEGRQQDALGIYTGQWRNDKRNGRGTQIYLNRDRYEGDWRDDQRQGQGTMYWEGGVYTGEWRNDRRNGLGTEVYRSGTRITAQFVDDVPNGPGTIISPEGNRFDGRIVGGCLVTEKGTFRILPGPGSC